MLDVISIALKAVLYAALLQASGAALFRLLWESAPIGRSVAAIDRLGRFAAITAFGAIATHQVLEPARMAGEWRGALDPSLQLLALSTPGGTVHLVQALAAGILWASIGYVSRARRLLGVLGIGIALFPVLLAGHTAEHATRWLLAPALAVHVSAAAFWFGALVPLWMILRSESPPVAGELLAQFSRIATQFVPWILIAGLVMAWQLLPSVAALLQPYGTLLIVKLSLFTVLMGLAALNKYRLGPALERGDEAAIGALNRSILVETLLIGAVFGATATLTTLYAPEM